MSTVSGQPDARWTTSYHAAHPLNPLARVAPHDLPTPKIALSKMRRRVFLVLRAQCALECAKRLNLFSVADTGACIATFAALRGVQVEGVDFTAGKQAFLAYGLLPRR